MTWREYLSSGDPGAYKPATADDSAPVWIVAAAWEMVVEANRWKGKSDAELAFQRTVECIKPLRG